MPKVGKHRQRIISVGIKNGTNILAEINECAQKIIKLLCSEVRDRFRLKVHFTILLVNLF